MGKPTFAFFPYEEYLNLLPTHEDAAVPHEVVGVGMEKSTNELRRLTLEKLAGATGISVEQLRD